MVCLTFLMFLTFLNFPLGLRNQALEAQGTQGVGAHSSRNPGRAQADTAHWLLWGELRTPYRQSLIWEKENVYDTNTNKNCIQTYMCYYIYVLLFSHMLEKDNVLVLKKDNVLALNKDNVLVLKRTMLCNSLCGAVISATCIILLHSLP